MANNKFEKKAIAPAVAAALSIIVPMVLAAIAPGIEAAVQNSKTIMNLLNEVIKDLDEYEKSYNLSFKDFRKICEDILASYKYLEENKDTIKQITGQLETKSYKKINLIKKANDNKLKVDVYKDLIKNMETFIKKCDEFMRESYSVIGALEKNKSFGGHILDVAKGMGLTFGQQITITNELIKDISSLNLELSTVQKSFQKVYDTLQSTTQTLVQQHTESQSEPEVATTAPVATQQTTPTATEKKVTSLEDLADLNWG